jgi:hypothetical protein
MKKLTDVIAPWGKFYTTFSDSFNGGGQDDDFQANNQARRKKMMIFGIVAIICSLVWLYYTMVPHVHGPGPGQTTESSLGQIMAEETIKAIGDHGTVVPVVFDLYTMKSPIATEWEAFAKEIKKHNGVTLAEPVIIKTDKSPRNHGISRADFDKVVEENAKADALVLFVGLPGAWNADNPVTLPSPAPKIIAVDKALVQIKPYFINSIVTTLITYRRRDETEAMANIKTGRAEFDEFYQVYTAENYQLFFPDNR